VVRLRGEGTKTVDKYSFFPTFGSGSKVIPTHPLNYKTSTHLTSLIATQIDLRKRLLSPLSTCPITTTIYIYI